MKCLEWANPQKQKVDQLLPGDRGREEQRVTTNRYMEFWGILGGDDNDVKLDSGDDCTNFVGFFFIKKPLNCIL